MTLEAYRDVVATCPGCSAPMEQRTAGDAAIDVCPTCRGLWLDWFDGETLTLVEQAMPLSIRVGAPKATSASCPRCARPLEASHHETSDAAVWRCGECAGTFLPRATVDALLIWAATNPHPLPDDAPPESVHEATLLARLRRALQALFGRELPR
jgi:Zn-finger nucleic acid-binding protein